MKLWQQPAQQLPVKVRPLRLETLTSYATRLAAANELARPTILIRALGHPHGNLAATTMHEFDMALNPPALARLETFTGIPAARLRMALPALNDRVDLPSDIPRTRLVRCWRLRRPCDGCAARVPGTPTIRTYRPPYPPICVRHRRWLGYDESYAQVDHRQVDLADAPEILTAHRRYLRLRNRIAVDADSREWLRREMFFVARVACAWVAHSRRHHPRLHQTWTARAAALWPWLTVAVPSELLVFPETVALAEILTDLNWRRHVAMLDNADDFRMNWFYRAVTRRLNQPSSFAQLVSNRFTNDPLRGWVHGQRHAHQKIRTEFWHEFRNSRLLEKQFPDIHHFT